MQEWTYTLDDFGALEEARGDLNGSTIEFALDNLTPSDICIRGTIQKSRDKGGSEGECGSWNFGAQYVVRQQSLNCIITRRDLLSQCTRGPFGECIVRWGEDGGVFPRFQIRY